jgi:hypothetical protein
MFDCKYKDCPNHPEYKMPENTVEDKTDWKHEVYVSLMMDEREKELQDKYNNKALTWGNLTDAVGWLYIEGVRICHECLICVHCPKIDIREIKIAQMAKDCLK